MLITETARMENVNYETANTLVGRNLVTTCGVVRCRFEMMVQYPAKMFRKTSNPFTHRGDYFPDNKSDPRKMLSYCIRLFTSKHAKEDWVRAILWDNSKPVEDPEREILRYEKGILQVNLLPNTYYTAMLQGINFQLPVHLRHYAEKQQAQPIPTANSE